MRRIILAGVLVMSLTGCMGGMIRADVGGYVGPVYISTSVSAPLDGGYYDNRYYAPTPVPYQRRQNIQQLQVPNRYESRRQNRY